METLTEPGLHWEILDEKRTIMLQRIAGCGLPAGCYLAGGTGLSLQTGYRESFDFDFFVPEKFSGPALFEKLKGATEKAVPLNISDGTVDVSMNEVQVSVLYYPYPLVGKLCSGTGIQGLSIASVTDIACMKMAAIGTRGARKDFFDLYHILQDRRIGESELPGLLEDKFGDIDRLGYIAMGLGYFDDAETQPLPKVFVPDRWEDEKKFFRRLSARFLEQCKRLVLERERENGGIER